MLAPVLLAVLLSSSPPESAPASHDRLDVEGVLSASLPTFAHCATGTVARTATFDFTITAAGTVRDVVRVSAADEPDAMSSVGPCVVERLRALTFAAGDTAHVRTVLRLTQTAAVDDLVIVTPSVSAAVRLAPAVPAEVAAAIAPHLDALEECYGNVLATSPSVAGTIIVQHTVGADGAVVDDKILPTQKPDMSQILHVPLNACVRVALRRVRYPTSPAVVTLPLLFVQPRPPPPSAMRSAFTQHLGALLRCLPARVPTATLLVAFTVDEHGAATDIVAPGSLELACAVTTVEGALWPAPSDGTVRVSAKFNAGHGGLSRAEIQRVVLTTMPRIKHCYDVELARDPTLQGTITMFYVIGADGSVVDVDTLRPTKPGAVELTNANVVACIADIIRRHRYPPPKGGGLVNVTYPFVFSLSTPAAEHAL
jgi:hypothetical protein